MARQLLMALKMLALATFIGVTLLWQGSGTATATWATAVTASGYHACTLTTDGGVKCWGYNFNAQLGEGTIGGVRSQPVDVVGLTSGVASVDAGRLHTCAVTTEGGLKCWGHNYEGELGDGQACGMLCPSPTDVTGLSSGVAAVAGGGQHTCALTTAGGVKCWGDNRAGQLGDGTGGHLGDQSATPVDVVGLGSGVVAVVAGGFHSCALTTEGGLKCWGWNGVGQLGSDTAEECEVFPEDCSATPVVVPGLTSGVAAVAAGSEHTCAVTTLGGVKCWGNNIAGQLGDGQACGQSYCTTPVDVTGLPSGVVAVTADWPHTCAITTDGGAKCWGANSSGGLGDGQSCGTPCTTPVDVSGLGSGVAGIAAGEGHTCAVMTAGGVMCWGFNDGGQVGDGTYTDRNTPVDVDVFGLGLGPKPVGGIAELPVVEGAASGRDGSTGTSAGSAALAGGAVAAGLAALASAAWYARRRRLRG